MKDGDRGCATVRIVATGVTREVEFTVWGRPLGGFIWPDLMENVGEPFCLLEIRAGDTVLVVEDEDLIIDPAKHKAQRN